MIVDFLKHGDSRGALMYFPSRLSFSTDGYKKITFYGLCSRCAVF